MGADETFSGIRASHLYPRGIQLTLNRRPQSATASHVQPLWLRVMTFAAMLLLLVGSMAQAAHVHGDWLPHHESQVKVADSGSALTGDEAGCPLCVAMHSALAVERADFHADVVTLRLVDQAAADRLVCGELHFTMFSRPPPAAADPRPTVRAV